MSKNSRHIRHFAVLPSVPSNFWFCFLFSTAIFLVLCFLPYPAPPEMRMDALSDGSTCPRVEWTVLTDHCHIHPPADSGEQWVPCAPPSPADADWVAYLLLTSPKATFDDEVWITDGVVGDFRRSTVLANPKIPSYLGFSCQKASASSLLCTLHAAPYRAYTVFVWCRDQDVLAAPPLFVEFFQSSGPNVRYSAVSRFGLLVLFGTFLAGLAYRLRPGGRVFRSSRWPRWISVTLMAAAGGVASAIIFAFRPPDFGGREQLIWGNVPMNLAVVILTVTLMGPIADFCRCRYQSLSGARQWVVLMSVVFATAALVTVYGAMAFKLFDPAAKLIHFKFRYYIYFFVAMWLTLITVTPSEWPVQSRRLSGSLPTTTSRALTLFLAGLVIGVAVNFVAIAAGDVGQALGLRGMDHGFYKPASAWGLLLGTAPAYFVLCTAVALGEERPPWVQDVSHKLLRFFGHPDTVLPKKKAQIGRGIARTLVLHHRPTKGFGTDPRFVATIAGGCLQVLERTVATVVDIEQLAAELGRSASTLTVHIAEIQRDLQAIVQDDPARERESPLVFVDASGGVGVSGAIKLRCSYRYGVSPADYGLSVSCNGSASAASTALYRQIQSLVLRVRALLGPSRSGEAPFGGMHISIVFEYPTGDPRDSFTGESYELALALLLTEAATGVKPAVRWIATGRLHPTGEEVLPVGGVAQKWEIAREWTDRAFVVAADNAPHFDGGEVILVSDGKPQRTKAVRAKIANRLRRGEPTVLACATLSLALEVLYPDLIFVD